MGLSPSEMQEEHVQRRRKVARQRRGKIYCTACGVYEPVGQEEHERMQGRQRP